LDELILVRYSQLIGILNWLKTGTEQFRVYPGPLYPKGSEQPSALHRDGTGAFPITADISRVHFKGETKFDYIKKQRHK
jgi:hypothetical protein